MSESNAKKAMQERIKTVSEQIEAVLTASGMALQPYLQYTEYGIAPRVRLVETNIIKDDEQTTDTGETTEPKDEDKPTGAESA